MGAYEVKPALARLKGVLLGAGVSLAAISLCLSVLICAPACVPMRCLRRVRC